MLLSELSRRDIAILGAGREGRAAWRWLRGHFPDKQITIYEEYAPGDCFESELAADRDRLVCGPFDARLLAVHDVLVRSPGISPYRTELVAAREAGIRFTSGSSLWFAHNLNEKTICITGTKGKSTTAALTAHLLKQGGCTVQLAGNIGRPLLECKAKGFDWWVIELSSYQLADLAASPTIAAILNLSDEHLDWHGSSRSYQDDKLRIASLEGDYPLVANAADALLSRRLAGRERIVWFGMDSGFHAQGDELWHGNHHITGLPRQQLRGPHNLENLAAALAVLRQAGFEPGDLAASLAGFKGLPHRLEMLGIRAGVAYVNDSLSTTPVATLAALRALKDDKVVLLAGGMDRGVDWRPAVREMKAVCPRAIICMPDNGPRIEAVASKEGLACESGIQCAADLEQAMQLAGQLAGPGDTVLLSPGAPSFPHFRDYEDRGRQFARLAGFES